MRAVRLYLERGRKLSVVIQELGYPSMGALEPWVAECGVSGQRHARSRPRLPEYSEEQRRVASKHYRHYGRNMHA